MKLLEHLQKTWQQARFPQSWIIKGQDEPVIDEILSFIRIVNNHEDILNFPKEEQDDNFNLKIIKLKRGKNNDLQKVITVDQIRELQEFFNLTDVFASYRFAIIASAELMNLHAANCCLKILETPPKNSFIFLVSSTPLALLNTIRSRCIIFEDSGSAINTIKLDKDLIELTSNFINPNVKFQEQITLIEQLSNGSAKYSFSVFTESILQILNSVTYEIVLTQANKDEQTIYRNNNHLMSSIILKNTCFIELVKLAKQQKMNPLKAIIIFDEVKSLLSSCESEHLDIKQVLIMLKAYFLAAFAQ